MKDEYVRKVKHPAPVTDENSPPSKNPSLYQEFKNRRFVENFVGTIFSLKNFRFEELKARSDLTFEEKAKLVGGEWRDQNNRNRSKKVRIIMLNGKLSFDSLTG
jgi:hypothetical protein